MQEIAPGIYHWTGHDGEVSSPVHSYYVEPAGALIDAVMPDEGPKAFDDLTRPQTALLTNRRHFRNSDRFRDEFGCVILAARPAMDDLRDKGVEPFGWNDEVAWGVTAIEIGKPWDDETALHIRHGEGAVTIGEGLVHAAGAPIAFAPDDLLGDRPERMRKALKDAFRGLLVRDFDVLLLSHGDPVPNHGKAALRRFVEEPTEYPEFGPYA